MVVSTCSSQCPTLRAAPGLFETFAFEAQVLHFMAPRAALGPFDAVACKAQALYFMAQF